MIIIPPSPTHGEYFRELAESTWNLSIKKEPVICETLKNDAKTLVITASGQEEDGTIMLFKLHYRYYKEKLYCFVEESEPSVIPDSD